MNRSFATRSNLGRLTLVCGFACLAFALATQSAQALPKQDPNNPTTPPKGKGTPQPNPWFGFAGNTAIVAVTRPTPPQKSTSKTVKTMNLKDLMTPLWNGMNADMQKQVAGFLAVKSNTGGKRLYNINVAIAKADTNAQMFLTVDPKTRKFGISYIVTGNEIDCSVDVPDLPDPSMRVKFDLMLTIYIDCNGTGNKGPLVLSSATLSFRNVTIDGDATLRAESAISQMFTGSNPTVNAQRAFNAGQTNVTSKLSGVVGLLNSQLQSYAYQPTVAPTYDTATSRLVLTLTPGSPIATTGTPNAR